MQAAAEEGFDYCTPIQATTLPLTLAGQDVMGQAQTGTGKTAAFLLSVMNRLLTAPVCGERRKNQPGVLILAPTRELVIQIHKDAVALARHADITCHAIYGGTGYQSQREQVQSGVDILIGTPGRTIDYFKQHVFDLRMIQAVVLDEADRMFDLGFIKDIRFLLRRCPRPEKRLSMLFSATMPLRVTELAYEHMNNPQHVAIEAEQVTAKQVEEMIFFPANDEKIPLLLGVLKRYQPTQCIIFSNTKRVTEKIYAYLLGNGYKAAILSGDVPQKKRQQLLAQFTTGELPFLVATDVAARGLHIPNITHVINFDLPQDCEDYVHRIGRTARAGASGVAISMACENYSFYQPDIEAFIGHKIPYTAIDSELLITPKPAIKIERRPPRKPVGGKPEHSRHRNSSRS
ncbi:MAG: DEAD/DEAH box helicase [Gammaproteobacteria bacterium]|nr:DEAD/DEAH box helicase [Gammaproteobacteria bacterium]MCF6229844.1 DEAD/DEAH box helicase [Gammaproteobacteria bacterium]